MEFFFWFFFLMASGVGFFWSILLLLGSARRRPGTTSIAILMFIFALTLFHYVLYWSGHLADFPHFIGLWRSTNYLYGPLLLSFFLTNKTPFQKQQYLHFIPFILLFVAWLPFGMQSGADKLIWSDNFSPYDSDFLLFDELLILLNPFVIVGSQVAYTVLFWWKARKLENVSRRLRMQIIGLFAIFILAQLSYFILVRLPGFKIEWDYMISFSMTLCISGIAYIVFHCPQYFLDRKKLSPPEGKYTTSSLTDQQSSDIAIVLQQHVLETQAFLDPKLRLGVLAEQLHYNKHQVSQAINQTYQCSFSDWINRHRIDYACQLLQSGSSAKEAAYQSGFNSISTFYTSFKKGKGMTPARYAKEITV